MSDTFKVWYLVGAIIVFFMQGGFAMVETGFTRAKNAGNIIMKNLLDFCIGTIAYMLLGAGILLGEDTFFGLIGVPNFDYIANYATYDWSSFIFNLVFCATASTIVSGAMAERTKFSSYCIYSFIISLVVYPVEAHWIWGGGWLSKLGFIDFAGSSAIHMVGGICALIGAIAVGPRIGKYTRDASGKVVKVNAIPGHSLTLGALGVFILWFCWYGFNGAAATDTDELAQILTTTTIAPAFATVACLIFTWIKNGKPDVSMCLNASLAGLVAVTAGCRNVDAVGAAIIGLVAGLLVTVVVETLDIKLHVDDPVGAVGVHMANGIWGTIAAGLFATSKAVGGVDGPIYALIHKTDFVLGLRVFGIQIGGMLAIALWTAVAITLTFILIKKTHGLRASQEEEIIGLDKTEHGLPSAYADFAPAVEHIPQSVLTLTDSVAADEQAVDESGAHASIEVYEKKCDDSGEKPEAAYKKIEIIFRERMLEPLKNAMMDLGITGMTVTHVMGCGAQKGKPEYYRGVEIEPSLLPKVQLEMVVGRVPVRKVIEAAKKVLYTGHIGDGKIFVYDVENVVKVRTGEEGYSALKDIE